MIDSPPLRSSPQSLVDHGPAGRAMQERQKIMSVAPAPVS